MTLLSPSRHHRLNEAVGLLLLLLGLAVCLSLVSYSASDPSWNTATQVGRTHNLLGLFGARWADFFLQVFGLSIFLLPINVWALGWKWVRSSPIESTWFRVLGNLSLWFCLSTACGLVPRPWLIAGSVHPGGLVGMVIADFLLARFDVAGSAIITVASGVVALYFASKFEVSTLRRWVSGPLARWRAFWANWRQSREARRQASIERAKAQAAERSARRQKSEGKPAAAREARASKTAVPPATEPQPAKAAVAAPLAPEPVADAPPFDLDEEPEAEPEVHEIPIRTLAYQPAARDITEPIAPPAPLKAAIDHPVSSKKRRFWRLPPTNLLHEVPAGNGYRQPGIEGSRQPDQVEARRVQCSRIGGADQSRSGCHDLRIQAGSRREVQPHHHAHGRSLPRAAGGIGSDRAPPRKTDRWHRSTEQQARGHQLAGDSRVGRISRVSFAR